MQINKKKILIVILFIILALLLINKCNTSSNISVSDNWETPKEPTITEEVETIANELAREIGEIFGEIKKEFLSGVEEGEK